MALTVAEHYRRFAEVEAADISKTYYDWAVGVAEDPDVASLIETLPRAKRQPNLVFGAARFVGAPAGTYHGFREWLLGHWSEVEPVIRTRSTQTNEAARCAVLLPVLEQLPGELSLIEAGASAGLVLYPDRYSYRYTSESGVTTLDPREGPSPVELPCRIDGRPAPSRLPRIVWRAGVDLNPIDVADRNAMSWLQALVWPEHDARRARLQSAAALVRADPPHLVAGDIVDEIPDLVAQAPAGSTVVVFHSAVLVYLSAERRAAFTEVMRGMAGVTWISNEGEHVLPEITAKVDTPVRGRTILAVDGEPVALVGPHGQSYQSL